MRECVALIWNAIDPTVRLELLEAIAHGAPHKPEMENLYWLAGEMLKGSCEHVAFVDACREVCNAMPEQLKN